MKLNENKKIIMNTELLSLMNEKTNNGENINKGCY